MKFRDLKTRTKILGGFMSIVLIAIIIGIIGVMGLRSVGRSFHAVAEENLPSIQYLGEMEANLERVQKGYNELLDNQLTRNEREAILSEIGKNRAQYIRNSELYAGINKSEEEVRLHRQLLQQIESWRNINIQQSDKAHADLLTSHGTAAEIAQRHNNALAEFSRIIRTLSNPAHTEAMTNFANLKSLNITNAHAAFQMGVTSEASSNAMVLGSIIIGIAVSLMLGFLIARMVTNGISNALILTETIAKGDLTIDADTDLLGQKDEIGQLARAMQSMVEKLREVIGGVIAGSDNIAAASQQMSSTAQEMSQGGTEQASSAEEVSSSMEEMAANIQQNTDNARETEKIARQAESGIADSSKASQQAVQAMRDIADKIGIIGEISRQTNILALNAAVEAARAGEHGRGFAVVAAEVRKLAERSQVAAAEIDKLSKFGVDISEEAGTRLANIVPDIQKTARLVQEIAAASIEQNAGADQVNSAIQQLNQITQQNAAASEEMATSSEELASQADQLLDMVSYFKLETNASRTKKKIQGMKTFTSKPVAREAFPTRKQDTIRRDNKGIALDMGSKIKDDEYEKF
jgi:methyl-accepting chemotaxis protein